MGIWPSPTIDIFPETNVLPLHGWKKTLGGATGTGLNPAHVPVTSDHLGIEVTEILPFWWVAPFW